MSYRIPFPLDHHTLAVSSPGGGVARQYVVQFQALTEEDWRRYGSFRSAEHAEKCLQNLHRRGYRARVVQHSIVPAAA